MKYRFSYVDVGVVCARTSRSSFFNESECFAQRLVGENVAQSDMACATSAGVVHLVSYGTSFRFAIPTMICIILQHFKRCKISTSTSTMLGKRRCFTIKLQ